MSNRTGSTSPSNPSANGADLYHSVEHKILAEYLGVAPLVPVGHINLWTQPGESEDFFAMEKAEYAGEKTTVMNAVARLALEGIQHRLPQSGVINSDGRIELARNIQEKKKRVLSLLPRFLFSINWATSGLGYKWPESYHYAYLPGYHVYVVTASQDSPEVHGYTDEAIGHFSADVEDVTAACGEVIRRWWKEEYSHAIPPWEEFDEWDTGQVDEETAKEWAWQVWGDGWVKDPPRWYQEVAAERRTEDEEQEEEWEEVGPGSAERPSFSVVC